MMHVIDAVLDSLASLSRLHRYSPLEKLYSVILFIAGLSLRDLSERLCLTGASRDRSGYGFTGSLPSSSLPEG
jgi:hypothetical protein